VLADTQAKDVDANHYFVDMNNDDQEDILLWDTHAVYIKYADQVAIVDEVHAQYYADYYVYPLTTKQDLIEDQEEGYITMRDVTLKIYDQEWEVRNFILQGQSFDSLTFQWDNRNVGDTSIAYILKLNQRIDTFHDDDHQYDFISDADLRKGYILVVPEGQSTQFSVMDLQHEMGLTSVESLLTGTIFEIQEYDPTDSVIALSTSEIPRAWQYVQIAKIGIDAYQENIPRFTKISPWSNQILAGRQVVADDIPPIPHVELWRDTTDTITDAGLDLNGYINTAYTMQITWEDNVDVSANWFAYSGQVLQMLSGDTMTLTGLWFDDIATQQFAI